MSKLRSFTIIELLVVMGIIAVMSGLSIYGLVRFQASTQVETVFNDVYSLFNTIENNARNSVSFKNASALTPNICITNDPTNCVPDYLGIKFDQDSYKVYACLKSGVNNIVCSPENEIEVQKATINGVSFDYRDTQCDYIVYERLSADMIDVEGSPNWLAKATENCTLVISDSYGDSRAIQINLVNNNIKDVGI